MRKYAIVIEHGEQNLSDYVPDLPGCVATGRTVEEIERTMKEAIEFHLEACERMVSLCPILKPSFLMWNCRPLNPRQQPRRRVECQE
jgi:predicted RNase H-like HicB family nuclease